MPVPALRHLIRDNPPNSRIKLKSASSLGVRSCPSLLGSDPQPFLSWHAPSTLTGKQGLGARTPGTHRYPTFQWWAFLWKKLLRDCLEMDAGVFKSSSQCCLLLVILPEPAELAGRTPEVKNSGWWLLGEAEGEALSQPPCLSLSEGQQGERREGAGSHCPREQHLTRLSPPPSSVFH